MTTTIPTAIDVAASGLAETKESVGGSRLTPATSTSMAAARRCRERYFGFGHGPDGSKVEAGFGATTVGTNPRTVSLVLRASQRQVNSCRSNKGMAPRHGTPCGLRLEALGDNPRLFLGSPLPTAPRTGENLEPPDWLAANLVGN